MRLKRVLFAGVAGLTLALAGCDGSVKWPGFEKRSDERDHIPPPPTVPDETPVPVIETPDPIVDDTPASETVPAPDTPDIISPPTPLPEDSQTDIDAEIDLERPTENEQGIEEEVGDDVADGETEDSGAEDETLEDEASDEVEDTGTVTEDETAAEEINNEAEDTEKAIEDEAPAEETGDDVEDTEAATEDETPEEETGEDVENTELGSSNNEVVGGADEAEISNEENEGEAEEVADTAPTPVPTPVEPDADDVPAEPTFAYHAPGDLIPGSGLGAPDQTVFAPDMIFPIQKAGAFAQSQVFRPGGFRYDGTLPGDECIAENYEYPWRDNFCERGRKATLVSPYCPAGSGVHQGQDIRVGDGPTCESMRRRYRTNTQSITDYKVVAAEDGVISNISTYLVSVRAGPRTYRYLHLNMRALQVSVGDEVKAGQLLGYVSKDFAFRADGSRVPTTFHLHFEIRINTENGSVFAPPYSSLVQAYARREGGPGEQIERTISIASDVSENTSVEVFEFSE